MKTYSTYTSLFPLEANCSVSKMSDNESRRSGGYRDRLENIAEADIADLENPWIFFQSLCRTTRPLTRGVESIVYYRYSYEMYENGASWSWSQ